MSTAVVWHGDQSATGTVQQRCCLDRMHWVAPAYALIASEIVHNTANLDDSLREQPGCISPATHLAWLGWPFAMGAFSSSYPICLRTQLSSL